VFQLSIGPNSIKSQRTLLERCFFRKFEISFHESFDVQILVMTPRGAGTCFNVLKRSVMYRLLGDFAI
jgi:hypothetical protein